MKCLKKGHAKSRAGASSKLEAGLPFLFFFSLDRNTKIYPTERPISQTNTDSVGICSGFRVRGMGLVRLGLEMLGFGVEDVFFFFFDRWRVGFEKASGLDYKLMYVVVNMIFGTFYCGCFSYFILLYILMLFFFFLL